MREFFEKHKEKIITLLLCGVLLIIVLSVLALISGAIMKVFGFEYRSIGSIILFFIIATIISYPLGLIAGALPKALLSLDKVSMPTAITLYLILDTFATFWGLRITDYCKMCIRDRLQPFWGFCCITWKNHPEYSTITLVERE